MSCVNIATNTQPSQPLTTTSPRNPQPKQTFRNPRLNYHGVRPLLRLALDALPKTATTDKSGSSSSTTTTSSSSSSSSGSSSGGAGGGEGSQSSPAWEEATYLLLLNLCKTVGALGTFLCWDGLASVCVGLTTDRFDLS
jgi:hypothetical protein